MIKRLQIFLLSFLPFVAAAQNNGPDMADAFRENGKINIVLAVIAIIFICIAAFLVYLERKVSKLEKTNAERSSQS